jgi:rare lipoprotein A
LALMLGIAGCSTAPKSGPRIESPSRVDRPAPVATVPHGGGYYQDDGPGDNPPPDLDSVPDAQPKVEPLNRFANNPYTVLGQTYVPDTSGRAYEAEGIASWYGRKFHGQRTSSGELYDMYGMTAAHPTLPIPSYARVTNLQNGKSVIVRINDRGPFHSDRVIDLSYTAAYKLGLVRNGSGRVRVESIDANDWTPTQVATVAAPVTPISGEPTAAVNGDGTGYWLQLGAFRMEANAQDMLSRLKVELVDLAAHLRIFSGDSVFRVRAGPYATESEAAEVASQVRQITDLAPLVVH